MFTRISNKVVALNTTAGINPAKVERYLSNGRAVVLSDASGLDPASEVDLSAVAANLRNLMGQVSRQYVERDELVEAFCTALAANEHAFVMSPPGTAKTSVVQNLSKGFGGSVWTSLMNQDKTRDSLLGTYDPAEIQAGNWTIKWASLATHDIAILDEIWKSSGQNANILLDALEERKVREGDTEQEIPLISALSMSNEIPEDSERQAIYDRFLVRLSVNYIQDRNNFRSMLVAAAGSMPISQTITTDELRVMGAAAEFMAACPPADILDTIEALWREIGIDGLGISDRRWRRSLKLVMAYALLKGEAPNASHCSCLKWTLWNDPGDEKEIRQLVTSKTDPFFNDLLTCKAKFDGLRSQVAANDFDPTDLRAKSEITGKAGKLANEIGTIINRPGNNRKPEFEAMGEEVKKFILDVTLMVSK